MARRELVVAAWVGAISLVGVAAAAAGSARLRNELVASGRRLGKLAGAAVADLQRSVRPRAGSGMEALEEIRQTLDAATTQWDSSMIVSKVSSSLLSEPRLRGRTVGARMIGGIIHLEGDVRSEEEKQLAGEIARVASGAELVANDLKVVSPIS